MSRFSYWLLLACFAVGCTAEKGSQQMHFPLKIGLLADSQITSQNGFSDFSQRSKFADKLVEVAIRPPAVEGFLALDMLQVAMDKLTQDAQGPREGVDVILYLGDGANSGGTDEMNAFFSVLEDYRARTQTPIFVVIGNHDYLGCGNITTPGTRFALLNRDNRPPNPALTKYQVLERISRFNHASSDMPSNQRFRYVDNIAMVEQNKDLDHETGLYLCGLLTYAEPGAESVEILLLDSSDYKDAPNWSNAAELGFYGAIGSVSFKDEPGHVSQLGHLQQLVRDTSPPFRFVASHYPKDHLDRITFAKPGQVPLNVTNLAWEVTEGAFSIPTFSESLNKNLAALLTSSGDNYWVSGHTHARRMPAVEKMVVGGLLRDRYFHALNVGSTTDYRAHVAIVEPYDRYKNRRIDGLIGYREVPLCDCSGDLMAALPKAISEYGRAHGNDPEFQWLLDPARKQPKTTTGRVIGLSTSLLRLSPGDRTGQTDWTDIGASVLGLNTAYREDSWADRQTEAAMQHARDFVTELVDRTGSNRGQVVAFLGLLAGAYEADRIPPGCAFHLSFLKPLCEGGR